MIEKKNQLNYVMIEKIIVELTKYSSIKKIHTTQNLHVKQLGWRPPMPIIEDRNI